ncbi:10781_t:CDS:2, partial [Diversispora eburnea]
VPTEVLELLDLVNSVCYFLVYTQSLECEDNLFDECTLSEVVLFEEKYDEKGYNKVDSGGLSISE